MQFKINADYHTHTFYSDGVGSIEDSVKKAHELGLKTIGITDHSFNHRKAGIKRENVAEMRNEVDRLKNIYPDVEILLGIEANLLNLNGDLDLTEEDIKNFDYIIFGIHYFTFGKGVKGSFRFNFHNLFKVGKKYIEKITDSYIKAMDKYPIKLIVHPNYVVPVNAGRLAKEASKRGVLIELNGKRTTFTEQQVKDMLETDVKFIIGSDAHRPEKIADISVPLKFINEYNIPAERVVNLVQKN